MASPSKFELQFRAVYPKARIEGQRRDGPGGKVYYLVRKTYDTPMFSGHGNTKVQAWKDACTKLPTPPCSTSPSA